MSLFSNVTIFSTFLLLVFFYLNNYSIFIKKRQDFLKNIGILYTLTNGFKNLDTVIKTEVNKKTNSKVKELSHVLNNTSRNVDGSIKFITSESDDSESKMKFQLDI